MSPELCALETPSLYPRKTMWYILQMTACAYISPSARPALLADTVISFEGVSDSNFHRPSTMIINHMERTRPVVLARKIHILDDMAFAFAGKVSSINEYIRLIRKEIHKIDRSMQHPLRPFRELANELPSIEVLGCLCAADRNHLIQHKKRFHLSNLNYCLTIGSGGDSLSAWLEEWNSAFDGMCDQFPYEVIRGVGQAASSKAIIKDFNGSYENWGCFFEYCFFNFSTRKWQFGPSNVYFVAQCDEVKYGKITTGICGRVVAYFPHDEFALIRSIKLGDNVVEDWVIDSTFENGRIVNYDQIHALWKNFRPFGATISFIPPAGMDVKLITVSTELNEGSSVLFNFNERDFVVGISDELWRQKSAAVAKIWDLDYIL